MTRLALLLLASCTGEATISVALYDTRADRDGSLSEACDFWGIECRTVESHHGRGSVSVILTSQGAPDLGKKDNIIEGVALHRTCAPVIWAVGVPRVIAHELGHVLGKLEDVYGDPENVMYRAAGTEASDEQVDAVQAGARRLARCAEGVSP